MAFEFTDANFQEAALDTENLAIVDFWAEWCGPCRILTPIIEQLSNEYTEGVTIGKMDVDSNPEVSFKYKVRNIPTILFFKNGELIDKHIGLTTKAKLEEKIKEQLVAQ